MKTDDLRKALNARDVLKKYYGDGKRYFGTRLQHFEYELEDGELIPMSEAKWFPKIDALKDEFDILKKEIKDVISEKQAAEHFMKNEFKCNHSVRISDWDSRGSLSKYRDTCVICGEKFFDSTVYKRKDIESLAERNQPLATFIGYENVTPSGFDPEEEFITNYRENDIIKILWEILAKTDSEDIDIVSEIAKLNLEKCIINKPHNKNLILIIVGSNKEWVDDYTYLKARNYLESQGVTKSVIEYFKNLYNVAIEILGDEETIKGYNQEDDLIVLQQYTGIEYLKGYLEYIKDIPFSLIIDMSSLRTYEVVDNQIILARHQIDLKSIFPNTPIVSIEDFYHEDIEVLESALKQTEGNTYAYKDSSYYYLEDGKLTKTNNACDKIKRLIRKKGN